MAAERASRRQMLGLLAAGLLTACSAPRRERGAALPSSTTAPAPAGPSPLPAGAAEPFFDTVHPTSGFVAFGDFGGGPAQGAVAAGMLQWVRDGHRVYLVEHDDTYQHRRARRWRNV